MKYALLILPLAALIAALVLMEVNRNARLAASMPPISHATHAEIQEMLRVGVDLIAIRGTGSMRPTIPAGDGVVAYALAERCAYEALHEGDLVVFATANHGYVIHQLAEHDHRGWITSGSANGAYDAGRVTAANFYVRATKIFVIQ